MVVSNRGNMGLRIIVFMGAATFLFLLLMAFGLKKSLQPPVGARVPEGAATSPFNEDRAWVDFEAIRAQGTSLSTRHNYVSKALRNAGLGTRTLASEFVTPEVATSTDAIVGVVKGNRPGVILLCVSLNSPTNGIDSGAADAAWLLEMARILGDQREGRSIWTVFLDGEVRQGQDNTPIVSRASKSLLDWIESQGEVANIEAVIVVQGIGDCALALQKDVGAPVELTEILWNTAVRQGYEKYLGKIPALGVDAHLAFREAGIPAVLLSDTFSGQTDGSAWINSLTSDTCRESLRAVGDVIYHALVPIEGHLDETGMRIDGQ